MSTTGANTGPLRGRHRRPGSANGTNAPADATSLGAVVPNPFNPVTRISARVTLPVYDVEGRLVARLVDRIRPAGEHIVARDARTPASGVHFWRLEAGGAVVSRRLVLLK